MLYQGQKFHHFKGHDYEIICMAKNSETNEDMVVYKALYGNNDIWVRPFTMFMSKVDKDKYPDIKQKYRFEEIK